MKQQQTAKKKLRKQAKIITTAFAVIFALAAFFVAVITDTIVLRKTEDMVGPEDSLSILFVGNSHVFVGDVPGQLQTVARISDIDIIYKIISRHGASLSDSKDKAISEIRSGRFDYVVLQDQGRRPLNDIEGFLDDVRVLCDEARENGAVPVLYSPAWTSVNGRPDEGRLNASTEVYKRAADENNTALVNASGAWVYAYQTLPDISLYTRFDLRGPHANESGAFLTACVFAATLFDLHIEEIPKDTMYKGADAMDLAQIAWKFVHQ
jgi:hypothetical protein